MSTVSRTFTADTSPEVSKPATPPAKAEFGAVRSHIRNVEDGAFILTAVTGRGSDARLLGKGNPTVTAPNSVAENPRLDW